MHWTSFREELKKFDKKLDIEFNGPKGQYEIYGLARGGNRYHIQWIPLGKLGLLGTHVLQALYDGDPRRQGGAKRMNRIIDQQIAEDDKAQEKHLSETMDHATSEAYDLMKRRTGMTQTLPGDESSYFQVKDRRRVSA